MSSRDVLEAQACRKRRESLEKASISLGHSNLLGVLAGLAAVDAIAKRDAPSALSGLREMAQVSGLPPRERGAEEHNETFNKLYPELARAGDSPEGAARQNRMIGAAKEDDARNRAAHRQADFDAARGRERRVPASDFAGAAEWRDGLTPGQRAERARDGFFDIEAMPAAYRPGVDVRPGDAETVAREAGAEVLDIDTMSRLMAARLRSRRFF